MKNFLHRHAIISFGLLTCAISACSIQFQTYDSMWYVVGKVVDEDNIGIKEASFIINNHEIKTDQFGCFELNDVGPQQEFDIILNKSGYKTLNLNQPFGAYFIYAHLTKLDSEIPAEYSIRKLDLSDPNLHVECR